MRRHQFEKSQKFEQNGDIWGILNFEIRTNSPVQGNEPARSPSQIAIHLEKVYELYSEKFEGYTQMIIARQQLVRQQLLKGFKGRHLSKICYLNQRSKTIQHAHQHRAKIKLDESI